MIDGYDAAAGFPMQTATPLQSPTPMLNVQGKRRRLKTLTIVLSYPCSYFDKMAAFASMSPGAAEGYR